LRSLEKKVSFPGEPVRLESRPTRERRPPMKVNSISGINCHVRDLARTAEFYEALGFRRGKEEPDQITFYVNWFFVTFNSDDNAELANEDSGLSVHIKVDDIEEFYSGVVSHGIKPASEPQKRRGGGREFMLRDPDGYKLVFFEKK
jgi:catechol 2,3-dioxygenase-like lactoylglutathione lyase family enzyme